MTLQYVNTKDKLPTDSDYTCPICLNNIDVDEKVDGVPNCAICSNGHRVHTICFNQMSKHECPVCKSMDMHFCSSRLFGYAYAERKGGKKRKTYRKKKKTHKKKRNTYKKKRNTCNSFRFT